MCGLFHMNQDAKRRLFLIVNSLFFLLGISSLSVGVWLYLEKNDFIELTPSSFSALSAAGLCSFSGAAICIISVVGCISVSMKGRCLIMTYMCFIALLAIVQGVTGITGLFYKESAREKIRSDLFLNINRTMAQTRAGRQIYLKISWDHLHESLQCCGVDGASDWYRTVQWPKNNFVPDSCCDPEFYANLESMRSCGKLNVTKAHWFKTGCYDVFAKWLYHHVHIVSALSLVLVLSETITLFLALVVICDCSESAGSYNYATAEAEEEQYPLEERKAGADDHSPSRENDIHA